MSKKLFFLIFSIIMVCSCKSLSNNDSIFKKGDMEKLVTNKEKIIEMENKIKSDNKKIHNILIIKNNLIAYEFNSDSYDSNKIQNIYSVTKSVMSILIGIANEKKYLDLNQKVLDFFTEYKIENLDDRKKNIKIVDLLTMASGIQWDEFGQFTGVATHGEMVSSKDWIQFILNQPMIDEPGKSFNYNSGNIHLLSAILQKSTKLTASEFADKYLFQYLDIKEYNWIKDPQGINFGAVGLQISPNDMAKIGSLYLNKGKWNGKQIINESWVTESTKKQIATPFPGWNYGYCWWLLPHAQYQIFSAIGYLGQFIIVIPQTNMIVVITSELTPEEYIGYSSELLYNFILQAF
ncbi:MAG: hypothetical protein A2086_07495 [Spirochaetes bacterium GWD1_27_9]|nr:MAG: hypothetical protein A2Z98_18140 [Spirochaetes bacterium GWB1_27_13]OHD27951.1 MAG: hypothetical protein A2Y34_13330 [Spirochaetes bacterium GWC1_27_15]OHD44777.1 MAG: hypothetical protein A2086_07495 [Spirochaetes bacterium GWD1_27_9]